MGTHRSSQPLEAMTQIPGGLFVLTSTCEGHSGAAMVRWVQPCSDHPPMVMVAIRKGQAVEPLIRGSRSFCLCQIGNDDRLLRRKFTDPRAEDDDVLISVPISAAPSGCPIIERAMNYLDCELVRHVELDSDYRIYVGQVHHGANLNRSAPAVMYGINGAHEAGAGG